MASRARILLAEPLDHDAEARLEQAGDVIRPDSTDGGALLEAIAGCDGLVARTHTRVTAELLGRSAALRVVGIAGVGLDRVDVEAAERLGVRIVHTPAAATGAVADLAVLLMLQLLRPTHTLAEAYRRGAYDSVRDRPHGHELRERLVGIIGMGRIGSRVGRICAAGFGARVLYNDIVDVGPFDFPAEPVSAARIYGACDIVTLHVPLTDATRGMIDAATLAGLREGAFLVNTSRGRVVDTDALVVGLRNGSPAGAALDVTDPEPLPSDHPLHALDNCIVLPHIAARTHSGLRRMFDVVDAVAEALRAPPPDARG